MAKGPAAPKKMAHYRQRIAEAPTRAKARWVACAAVVAAARQTNSLTETREELLKIAQRLWTEADANDGDDH